MRLTGRGVSFRIRAAGILAVAAGAAVVLYAVHLRHFNRSCADLLCTVNSIAAQAQGRAVPAPPFAARGADEGVILACIVAAAAALIALCLPLLAPRDYRCRDTALFLIGAACVALLGFWAWWGRRCVEERLAPQRNVWQAAARAENWTPGPPGAPPYWRPIVEPVPRSLNSSFAGGRLIPVGGRHASTIDFLNQLPQRAEEPICAPLLLGGGRAILLDIPRRDARHALLQACAVRPLLDASNRKMLRDEGPWTWEGIAHLTICLRMEAFKRGVSTVNQGICGAPMPIAMLSYAMYDLGISPQENHAVQRQVHGLFPPEESCALYLPVRTAAAAPLPEAIEKGVVRFIAAWQGASENEFRTSEKYSRIRSLAEDLKSLEAAEAALQSVSAEMPSVSNTQDLQDAANQWKTRYDACRKAFVRVDKKIAALGGQSLAATHDKAVEDFFADSQAAKRIDMLIGEVTPAGPSAPDCPALAPIRKALETARAGLRKELAGKLPASDLARYDSDFLAIVRSGGKPLRLYQVRGAAYAAADADLTGEFAATGPADDKLARIHGRAEESRQTIAALLAVCPQTPSRGAARNVCNFIVTTAERSRRYAAAQAASLPFEFEAEPVPR